MLSAIKILADDLHARNAKIREEQGEEAAKKDSCSNMGAGLGMLSGAMTGGAIGSVVPVVGTLIGTVVGGIIGIVKGGQDETPLDNVKTGIGIISSAVKDITK